MAGLTDSVGGWGTGATPDQWADAGEILSLDGPRRYWLGRAKGYSKTRDVAGLSVVALLTQFPPGAAGYCAASDSDQASLIRQSVQSFVTSTPALDGLVNVDARKISTPQGSELIILAADSAGAHGLRPYWLVVDELANWPDTQRHREFFDALWAGLPKVRDSRGIIMTTAGAPSHFSRRTLDAAKGDPSWYVSDLHGPPPWVDPAEIESERRRLFPSTFARLWLNEWAEAEDSIADPADVAAACTLDGPLAPEQGRQYIITLDLGVRNDRTAAVIAHSERTDDGVRVVVDRLAVWTPKPLRPVKLDDVKAWLIEMGRSYRATVHYDPSQAYLLVEQLRKAGLSTKEFTFTSSSVGKIATAIMQALRSRLLTLPDDDELRKELLSVRLRETSPNVMRIDHASGSHDDRVIACAMAVYQLTTTTGGQAREWMESLAPIGPCGHPSLKGSTACQKCGIPLSPVVEEAAPEPSAEPFSFWSTPNRAPDPTTVAVLQQLQEAGRSGWTRTF
jgi:phage terminase large subunit-like protein